MSRICSRVLLHVTSRGPTRKKVRSLAVAAAAFAITATAQAGLLVPGTTILAPLEAGQPLNGVEVAAKVAEPFNAGAFSGTLTTRVIAGDATNPLGLTFTYLLTNNAVSSNVIERLTVVDFLGFLTDVSYDLAGQAPTTISRSTADVVGFNFVDLPLGAGVLMPGATSALLVIQTNAPTFRPSTAFVIDGAVATVATYAPIPEPGVLAGLAIGMVALLRRRRRFA
ncbi:MAG: hypothetical protein AMXMBFR13_38030 [Phycisphaerae bacterium]